MVLQPCLLPKKQCRVVVRKDLAKRTAPLDSGSAPGALSGLERVPIYWHANLRVLGSKVGVTTMPLQGSYGDCVETV